MDMRSNLTVGLRKRKVSGITLRFLLCITGWLAVTIKKKGNLKEILFHVLHLINGI